MTAVIARAASAAGGLLSAATAGVAALRPAAKPLHPRGELRHARIYRSGSREPTGVAWLDEPGQEDVVVRLSRAVGLPGRLPDIHGLAIRVPSGDGYGDLLLATTGTGRLSRFVLLPSRNARSRPMTTLLPYEAPSGPLLLGAVATGVEVFELSWARPSGDWQAFGVLRLSPVGPAESVSFDPVRHRLPGLEQYAAVERLREPAYHRARRSRHGHQDRRRSTESA